MARINGKTKEAKRQAGKSQACSKCPLLKQCNMAMLRACTDSFVEGFLKGINFAKNKLENEQNKNSSKG